MGPTPGKLVVIDNIAASRLMGIGVSFDTAIGYYLKVLIATPPNGSSVWVPPPDKVTGAV